MFCTACGTPIQPGHQFCAGCGRPAGGYGPGPGVGSARGRVRANIRPLGILWIVASALRVLPVMGLHWFWPFRAGGDWPFWGGLPGHFLGFFGALSGVFALMGVLGILAGWGLLSWQPWARTLAIVLGCIALIHIPFGTALGIYTLWVLLPEESAEEFRRAARG